MENKHPIIQHTLTQELFPAALWLLPDTPSTLYTKGVFSFHTPRIAIVGTRKASQDSIKLAKQFSASLTKWGCVIISGLAYGIDTAAHEGALENNGVTWAIMATGLDTIYPPRNHSLALSILNQGGCLWSEYPEETPSYPSHFLARNRIISALSDAVVIIEAPNKSGAMTTAAWAKQLSIPLFVTPGPATAPSFGGSHRLIQQGASLVTKPEEIAHQLGITSQTQTQQQLALSSHQQTIITALKNNGGALHIDKIIEITTLSPHIVTKELTVLSLNDCVTKTENTYTLTSSNL